MENEFFSKEERSKLLSALKDISNIEIHILDRDKDEKPPLDKQDELTDRQSFFAQAKLWRVIETIIREVYLDKLINKGLSFHDGKGHYFVVVPKEAKHES